MVFPLSFVSFASKSVSFLRLTNSLPPIQFNSIESNRIDRANQLNDCRSLNTGESRRDGTGRDETRRGL